ncbi:outer membrane transport energization protein ExbD (TC 2.C.1.1.1) [Chitinimonas taiwanensis DSM 18899]|uniref:Outer membrane transport energization protein ExbD (TC 2.C.1.1.1) n=2 Tax=Chitinimonas TaxID=240411 RepID=A0A1K2HFR1_9NEIS|nr:outer membrane transport energization protein ExbD (TC 2.C.1.1.1) [Chitinimonas taiwanensis DSM 18899]
MGMSVGSGNDSGDPEVMAEMNTTPLIDVMLVLLIMLIITIPVQLHSIETDNPVGNPPPPLTEPIVHKIDIDEAGVVYVDGAVVNGKQALEDIFRQFATAADQPEVHVKPRKGTPYRQVAMVMAAAQRAGVTKFGLVE